MAKVSICIPAYGNEAGIRRLLQSIEEQKYGDYEVIITEDTIESSVEDTVEDSVDESIAEVVREKSYVKYYRNKKRLGATVNWNEAIGKSSGEYIKLMHHDDWFSDENSLGKFVELLDKNPQADLAFSGTVQEEAERSYTRCITKEDAEFIRVDYHNLYMGNTIGAPSAVIIRRNNINTGNMVPVKYDENLKWLVDMEYYMRVLSSNPIFAYTEEPLISIGVSEEQLTEECRDDGELNIREYGYIFDKYNLNNKTQYREKLIRIFSDNEKSYADIKKHGIVKTEYTKELRRKFVSKVKWKMGISMQEKESQ